MLGSVALETLVKLQGLDLDILECAKEGRNKRLPLQEKAKEMEAVREAIAQMEHQLREKQKSLARQELDLSAKEENIRKLEGQLNTTKTNKEYSAILNAIAGEKADVSVLEDQSLDLMTEIDALRGEAQALENKLQTIQEETRRLTRTIEHEIVELDNHVQDLTAKRNEVSRNIDPELLDRYTRLTANLSGGAMAKVSGEVCGGCHMQLRPQIINRLMADKEVLTCPFCQRILYVDHA